MTKKKKIIVFAIVAVILLSFGAYAFVSKLNSDKDTGVPVELETAKIDTIVTTVTAKGEVSLLNTELIYSNIAAEVAEVLVEKNDVVVKGQPVIRYKEKTREKLENDLRNAELNVRSAEIALSEAKLPPTEAMLEKARLDVVNAEDAVKDAEYALEQLDLKIDSAQRKLSEAKKELADTQTLFTAGAASQYEVETTEKEIKDLEDSLTTYLNQRIHDEKTVLSANESLDYMRLVYEDTKNSLDNKSTQNTIAQQQIALEKSRLAVEELKADLRDFQYEIYSPIDGTVTLLNVSQGEVTPTDKALMEISNVSDYVVKVDVNERNAAKVEIGQEALIEGSVLGNKTVMGKVSKIGYIAEIKQTNTNTERVVPVEITVNEGDTADLKPGFSLEATITTQVKENVVVVPILSTVSESDGNNYVFVIGDDNTLEKRPVTLGAYADMTVEAEGLKEGEKIVAQPTIDMADGMKVTPVTAEEEDGSDGKNDA